MASLASRVRRLAGRACAGLLVALLVLAFGAHPLVATEKQDAPDLVWQLAMYAVPWRSIHSEYAMIWAPTGRLIEDGFRMRLAAGGGRSFDGCCYTDKGFGAFEVGWRGRHGRTSFVGWIGVEHQAEDGLVAWGRTGARATLEIVTSPSDDGFLALHARMSTILSRYAVTVTAGTDTPFGFRVGPEFGISGDRNGASARMGLGAFGIPAGKASLSLSAGFLRDERGRFGRYLSLFLTQPF